MFSDIARFGAAPVSYPDSGESPANFTFNFDANVPDEDVYPLDDLIDAHQEAVRRYGARALEYTMYDVDRSNQILYPPSYDKLIKELLLGNGNLREQIAAWVTSRQGVTGLGADNVILTPGSVGAIGLVIEALIDEGDVAFVESLTFMPPMQYIAMRGGSVRPVALDEDGMDMDALEEAVKEAIAQGKRPKLVYVVATFQMPTGVCTSLERRRRLLELADRYDFMILEDNVYGDLRFYGEPIPTMLSMDTVGRVIQVHTFSKNVAPGLRLGWATASAPIINAMSAVRRDQGINLWASLAMSIYMEGGRLDAHLDRILPHYRHKLDVTVECLHEHCEPYVNFRRPDGGYFVWLALADGVDWEAARLNAQEHGILFRPGERFLGADMQEHGRGFFRLAFSHPPEAELRRGIAALGEALAKAAV
jgi:2-aminoadipate transaminase